MPLQTRKLSITIMKVDPATGNYRPDTGLTVKMVKADDATDPVIFSVDESPIGSGIYKIRAADGTDNFIPTPQWGFWKVGGTVKKEWGRVGLGVDGQERRVDIFKKIEVFNATVPLGNKGAGKTFTSGTAPLATNSDGYTPPNYAVVPIVMIDGTKYQERYCYLRTTPSLAAEKVTFQTEVSDIGENNADGKCYSDIIIISLD